MTNVKKQDSRNASVDDQTWNQPTLVNTDRNMTMFTYKNRCSIGQKSSPVTWLYTFLYIHVMETDMNIAETVEASCLKDIAAAPNTHFQPC